MKKVIVETKAFLTSNAKNKHFSECKNNLMLRVNIGNTKKTNKFGHLSCIEAKIPEGLDFPKIRRI